MPIVVSDTSAIRALSYLGRLDLLPKLMDEAFGRAVARRHGLVPVGVLGLLVRAKRDGHVERVQPLMDRLRKELRFFISEPLRGEILRLAGESGPSG